MVDVIAIERACDRIKPYLDQTPLRYSPALSRQFKANIYLKMEIFQPTGSFKVRGAFNKILSLDLKQRKKGVVAASTGNFGLAVGYATSVLNVKATVFVPRTINERKLTNLRDFGVSIKKKGDDGIEAEKAARAYAEQKDRAYLSPYNDTEVIAGQGTIAAELCRQLEHFDCVWAALGGGGLLGGIGSLLKCRRPATKMIGCSPKNSAIMYESLQVGHILDMPSLPTLSDGTAGGIETGSITLDLCQRVIDEHTLISEEEIARSLLDFVQRHPWLIEGSAALPLAGFRQKAASYKDKVVVLILCGANIDLNTFKGLLSGGSP